MRTLYEEYAVINAEIDALESKKDQLRGLILEDMGKKGEQKVETALGKFTITQLKKYSYSEKTLAIGESFKAAKAKEESTGEAIYIEQPSLRFSSVKL